MLRRAKVLLSREDGQALVELALALPILLIVVLAIFDFGRAVNYWNSETSLANVGARYAAVGTLPNSTADPVCGSNSNITTYIQCEATHVYGISDATTGQAGLQPPASGSDVTVCVIVPTNAVGDPVTVEVFGRYQWLPLPKALGGQSTFSSIQLMGTATMRLENTYPSSWTSVSSSGSCPSV